VERTAWLAS